MDNLWRNKKSSFNDSNLEAICMMCKYIVCIYLLVSNVIVYNISFVNSLKEKRSREDMETFMIFQISNFQ